MAVRYLLSGGFGMTLSERLRSIARELDELALECAHGSLSLPVVGGDFEPDPNVAADAETPSAGASPVSQTEGWIAVIQGKDSTDGAGRGAGASPPVSRGVRVRGASEPGAGSIPALPQPTDGAGQPVSRDLTATAGDESRPAPTPTERLA